MWRIFREFHEDDTVWQLQVQRYTCGFLGITLGFSSVWNIANGYEWGKELIVMIVIAILGIIAFFAFSRLIKERKQDGA